MNEMPTMKSSRTFLFIALAVGALIAGALTISSMQKNRSFDQAIERVEDFIKQDDFDAALKALEEARKVKPEERTFFSDQVNRIKSIKTSQEALAEAEGWIEKKDYLTALTRLRSVDSTERDFVSRASQLKVKIRPLLVAKTEETFKELIRLKRYEEAIALISETNKQLDVPKILVSESLRVRTLLEDQKKAEQKAALSKLRSRYDRFGDVTWYQSSTTTNYRNANAFYVYFGMFDGEKGPLRLVVQYFDDDWLFIERARVNVDGKVYTLSTSDWERDNDADIWEWSDESLQDRDVIEKIIKSKSAVIRFDGRQYYDTRTISSTQKAALKAVLQAWDLQP